MSDKYRNFSERIAADLHSASISANTQFQDKIQRIRLRDSALPSALPSGCTIEIESVTFHKVKFGTIVYVKLESGLALRRFLRVEVIKDHDFVVVVKENAQLIDRLPANALVGRVIAADVQGKSIRVPHGGSVIDWMTDFGVTTPVHKIKDLLHNWKGDKPPTVADSGKKKSTPTKRTPGK